MPSVDSEQPTRIVRVIARLNVGGPTRHVVWLTSALQGSEFSSVLITGSVSPGEDDMSYFAADEGVEPIVIPDMSREISPRDLLVVWKVYRLFIRLRPDIVHTHTAKAGTVGRLAGTLYRFATPGILLGRPRRCKFVHTYHGHVFHSYYGWWKTRFFLAVEKSLARLTHRIVVISQQQYEEIHGVFGVGESSQFEVIPLGIDLAPFLESTSDTGELRATMGASEREVVIGIVGRLTEIKNHTMLFRAVSELAPQDAGNFRLAVIGDGQLRPALERLSDELGIRERVSFLGMRRDPSNVYKALDIVALCSLNEGTPLSLIEAMASEKPVISTLVGGVVDLLGQRNPHHPGGNGWVVCERGIGVEPGKAGAFASGLRELMVNSQLRMELAKQGRSFVVAAYSKERLIDEIRQLYRSLSGQKKTSP